MRTYDIPKEKFTEAFEKVKANKGSYGVDGVTVKQYEAELEKRLYKVWNRMSSGSYFPKAVRKVEIPKADGKKRTLGIPTIEDRVAQTVVRDMIEERLEAIFSSNSYGYRRGKSQHMAVEEARRNCWKYDYVLDLDIKGFFDNINHELMMKAVEYHIEEKWIRQSIERWLKSPYEGEAARSKGTPQGGVISPILANLYLHYALDKWLEREYPKVKFERYADDMILHCKTAEEAEELKEAIEKRLSECELELNQEKSQISYCQDEKRRKRYPKSEFHIFRIYVQRARGENTGK